MAVSMRARQLLLLLSISSCSTNLFWSASDGRASSPPDGLESIYLGGESTPGYHAARGGEMTGRIDGQDRSESWLDAVVRAQTRRMLLRQRRQSAPSVYVSGAGLEEAVMGERATIVVEVQGWSKVRYRHLASLPLSACFCRGERIRKDFEYSSRSEQESIGINGPASSPTVHASSA